MIGVRRMTEPVTWIADANNPRAQNDDQNGTSDLEDDPGGL